MSESLGNKTITGVIWSLIQRFGVMFVSFVTNMILARLLTPDDFGAVGMLLIFISVANTFVDGGFAAALIQKKNPSREDYSTIFYWNLLVSAILVAVLFVAAPSIARFYNMPLLEDILKVQSFILVINAFSIVQQNILIKHLQFKKLAFINLIGNTVGAVVAIVLAYKEYGVWSLVYKNLISALGIVLIIWIVSQWRPMLVFDKKSFRSLGGFGMMILFSNLVETIYTEIQGLIIGRAYSARDLGYYTQAKRLEEIPTLGFSAAINQVTFPIFSSAQDDIQFMRNVVRKNMRMISLFVFPLYMLLILIAEPLIVFLFSDKWLPAVPFFQILCFVGMIYPQNTVNTNIVKALGLGRLYFYLQFGKRLFGILLIFIGMQIGGLKGLMWALVVISYVVFVINTFFANRLIHYGLKWQCLDIVKPLAFAIFSFLIVYCLFPESGALGMMLIQSLVFICMYFLFTFFFNSGELKLVYNILKHRN